MALDSIATSAKFQQSQLGGILDGAKDKQHVKLDDTGKFKIGFSTLMGKIKYALLSDKPVHKSAVRDGIKQEWTAKSERTYANGATKVMLNSALGTAGNQTAMGQLKKDLEALAQNPRYKDSPLINTPEARESTLAKLAQDFKESYQETFSTAASNVLAPEMKSEIHSGVGRVTVGKLKEAVQAVDAQVAKAYGDFFGTDVLSKLESSLAQPKDQVQGQVGTLVNSGLLSDHSRSLGVGLGLGPRGMNMLTSNQVMGGMKESDLTFSFSKMTDDSRGPSISSMINGLGLSRAATDDLMVKTLLGRFDGETLAFKFGELAFNKLGSGEGSPFNQIDRAVSKDGLSQGAADKMKARLLLGEMQPNELTRKIEDTVAVERQIALDAQRQGTVAS